MIRDAFNLNASNIAAVHWSDVIDRGIFYAKECDVNVALNQFKKAIHTREVNQWCFIYEAMDVHAFEKT